MATYKGVQIALRPTQLANGGWQPGFTLVSSVKGEIGVEPNYAEASYSTRQEADKESLNAACRAIDKS